MSVAVSTLCRLVPALAATSAITACASADPSPRFELREGVVMSWTFNGLGCAAPDTE
jgi:hypothetical protein